MAKPMDRISAAIMEAFAGVLAQKGYAIIREADTQHALQADVLSAVLREAARNATQDVLLIQDEQASCAHELVEVLAIKPRSLDGARRVCAHCQLDLGAFSEAA